MRFGAYEFVVAGFGDRLQPEIDRRPQIVVVRTHAGKPRQHSCPLRAGQHLRENLLEKRAGSTAVARFEVVKGSVGQPETSRHRIVRRSELGRALKQLGRRCRRTARAGAVCRRGECCRDLDGGPSSRERQVARLLLWVANEFRQPCVHRTPLGRVHGDVRTGGEERMRELDAAPSELDYVCLLGGTERVPRPLSDPLDQVDGWLLDGRGDSESALGRGWEGRQPIVDEGLERLGQSVLTLARLGARELEREKRVAARELTDSPQQRPRKRDVEPLSEQPVQRTEAKRSETYAPKAVVERTLERERLIVTDEAAREKERDGFVT